jgi:riboflavin synthase
MFTGIVSDVGQVLALRRQGGALALRVACAYPAGELEIGASIACAGACLTVTAKGRQGRRSWFEADASAETLARTTLGGLAEGARLNLERPLKVGDELGGHMVLGHVDGIAEIVAASPEGASRRVSLRATADLARFIAPKGSVTLDGTSLTVNEVDGTRFGVNLIPHTLKVTTWGARGPGDRVNLEIDVLARYVARLAEAEGLAA